PWKLLLLALSVAVLLGYLGWQAYRWLRRPRTVAVSLYGVTMRMTLVHPREHPPAVPPAPPGQQQVVAALQVSNDGQRPFHFDPGRFLLLDEQNRSFAAHPIAEEPIEGLSGEGDVPPSSRELFILLFTLPAEARP